LLSIDNQASIKDDPQTLIHLLTLIRKCLPSNLI
jgi:hypothetical protein